MHEYGVTKLVREIVCREIRAERARIADILCRVADSDEGPINSSTLRTLAGAIGESEIEDEGDDG